MTPGTDITTRLLAELGWVHRLARHLVGDAAEDLTQDVAALALEKGPNTGLRAWLGSVTRRLAARWHRDRQRRREVEGSGARGPVPDDDPAAVVARLQGQRRLAQAVLELAEPYRSVIVVRFFDGLAPAEIARRRRVSPATARQQVHRGLELLRARLERDLGRDWRSALVGLTVPRVGTGAAVIGGVLMVKKLVMAAGIAAAALVVLWEITPGSGDGQDVPLPAGPPAELTGELDTSTKTRPVERQALPVREVGFLVEVVREDGEPVPDARVLLQGSGPVQQGHTDASGALRFDPDPSPGTALVLAAGRAPYVESLGTLTGHARLVLPAGHSVAGRVHVFDRPLPGPVRLRLSRPGNEPVAGAEVPASLQKEVGPADLAYFHTTTDPTGRFSFDGLAEDWSGVLEIGYSEPYWIRPGESNLDPFGSATHFTAVVVPRPADDIVLSLTRLPSVHGRLLWEDGAPIVDYFMSFQATFANGRNSPGIDTVRPDDAGRVEVGFALGSPSTYEAWLDPKNQLAIESVHVTVRHPDARTDGDFQLEVSGPGLDHDLGDLYLERAPRLHVLVQDRESAPVVGAVVEGRSMPAPTGKDGRGEVLVEDLDQRTFRIGAPGALVDHYGCDGGTGTAEDPLRFTVRPGNRLTVTVEASELPVEEMRLEVHSAEPSFTTAEARSYMPSSQHITAGTSRAQEGGSRIDPPSGEAIFHLEEANPVELCSVVPGLTVRLRVLDDLNQALVERTVRLPELGASESILLESDDRACILRGTVTLDGLPLAGAGVSLMGNGRGLGETTGPDGTFETRILATGEIAPVRVDHPSAPLLETELQLLPGIQRPRFALRSARQLSVRVLDQVGNPVPARITFPEVDAAGGNDLGSGHWRFDRLPDEVLAVRAEVAGRRFERSVARNEGSVEFRVPVLSRVRLRLPPDLAGDPLVLELDAVEEDVSLRLELRRVGDNWTPAELLLFPGRYRVRCGPRPGDAPPWEGEWTIPAGADIERTLLFREDAPPR